MSYNGVSWEIETDERGSFHQRLGFHVLAKDKRLCEISLATKISIGSLHGYCTGKNKPPFDKVVKICDYLKISVLLLVGADYGQKIKGNF